MPINKQQDQTRSPVRKCLGIAGVVILIAVLGYYGNKAIQTYLGQQAIDETGMTILSLAQALEEAKNSDRLVLADMSAIWCPSCRKLDKQVFADEQVKSQMSQDFVYTRIEYDSPEGDAFIQNYQVNGFPTLVVLSAQGEKLVQLPVSYEPQPFLTTLANVVEARR